MGTSLARHEEPFAVFLPDVRRYLVVEFWSAALALASSLALLSVFQDSSYSWLLTAVAAGLLGVVYHAVFARRARQIAIGDVWIRGPSGTSGPVTIRFDMVDWTHSGLRRGRLPFKSPSGHGISVRAQWFAPEDVQEIKRLVRDRCHTAGCPPGFY